MADHNAESLSALRTTDSAIANLAYDVYGKTASDEQIERAKKALEAKTHKVSVVSSKQEAVDLIAKSIPAGASIMNAGSRTLIEIGLTEYLKTQQHGWKNLHEEILAEKDQAKAAALRRQSMTADYFLSSVTAVTEEGDITVCDLTGSRVGAFNYAAGNLVIVIGSNKIVPTYDDAVKRTYDYCLPIESARVRIAYKVPASAVNNFVAVRGPNPWGAPGRVHVVIVKEALGF
jgi:L-lactate utilization protein LutB